MAQSGHATVARRCPLLGVKRTSTSANRCLLLTHCGHPSVCGKDIRAARVTLTGRSTIPPTEVLITPLLPSCPWPARNLAVDPARLNLRLTRRHIFVECTTGARCENEPVLRDIMPALLFRAGQRFAGPPVVVDLVVVPLREDGHFGIERQDILIEQVVFEIAAKFVERLGGLSSRFHHSAFSARPPSDCRRRYCRRCG